LDRRRSGSGARRLHQAGGSIDFISPLPSPFNYGAIPGTVSTDGDRLDVVLLGPTLPRGTVTRSPVQAVVRFLDAGDVDDKLICSAHPLTPAQRTTVRTFFQLYATAKTVLNRARGKNGRTAFLGWEEPVTPEMLP
jgi:inorganic pyrophosphatase